MSLVTKDHVKISTIKDELKMGYRMPPVNMGYAQVNMYRDGGAVLEKPEIASLEKLLAQTP